MKIVISYFYQVRYFDRNIIPLSTACWDPKWYHNFKGPKHVFIDKRGIVNGLRIESLVPNSTCNSLCRGRENCLSNPTSCTFLNKYEQQLLSINFQDFVKSLEEYEKTLKETLKIDEELTFAILVHEAPDNPCSERVSLFKWFNINNYSVEEYKGL